VPAVPVSRLLIALAWMLFTAPGQAQPAVGDAARGAAIANSRSLGLCVLCHALPGVPPTQAGTMAPALAGVGARLSADELRERLVAPERFNPDTIMPSARRSEGLNRVAGNRRGKPLLDEQQVDDLVAYLVTLR
jgi:L-cysteine S-thiosulfotransferase